MKNVIEIKDLIKKYDEFTLKVNMDIPSGLIIGLIGENGAGKTTLIKCILNIINNYKGEIKIFNLDNKKDSLKEEIGVVLDNSFFPEILKVKDIDTIMKSIYQKWDSKLFFKYLQDFQLPNDKTLKELSKGMLKKLEIATALSHHPKLLILDEPTSGLDPVVRSEVLEIFQNFISDEDHSIILSTHITSDLEHIADRIIFIDNGSIVSNLEYNEILDNYGILKCDSKTFEKLDKSDIIKYKKNKYNYEVLVNNKTKVKKKYKDIVIDKITLEDFMVLMIKGGNE